MPDSLMIMKPYLLSLPLRAALLLGCAALTTPSGRADELGWSILAGGGATLAGGGYTLDGTVGQPAASSLSGGGYDLAGGFWSGLAATVRVEISRSPNGVTLSWTGAGYTLQSGPDPVGPWTDLSPGTSSDGALFTVHTAVTQARTFFRLRGNP